jgi:hypothetical protein
MLSCVKGMSQFTNAVKTCDYLNRFSNIEIIL